MKDKLSVHIIILIISIIIFIVLMPLFEKDIKKRPIYEKLGYIPTGKIMKIIAGEFRWFLGEYYTFKAITYYGDLGIKALSGEKKVKIEYYNLYKIIETAIILNPYHEDSYYFAQAIFTWNIGRIKEVNSLLRYVFHYRTWDFKIPFFMGFNYSYFLKQYEKAAMYYKKAAEISGNPFFTDLAIKCFYKSGRIELGISFLRYMIKHTKNNTLKETYEKRLKRLEAIQIIKDAIMEYKRRFRTLPADINNLVTKGILEKIPKDPFGGKFYLDKECNIKIINK